MRSAGQHFANVAKRVVSVLKDWSSSGLSENGLSPGFDGGGELWRL